MIKQTTQVICDRCNKEITNGRYYTISVNNHDIINRDDSLLQTDWDLLKITPAIWTVPQREEHYCDECIGAIRQFIYKKN